MWSARLFAVTGLIAALLLAGTAPGRAQSDYPHRSITLIVPFAPGGSTDVIARVIAEAMRADLGQPIVIDNRAGAGGSIGTAAIAQAAPDGYTIGIGTASTLAINPATYRSLSYDVQKDLAPITNIAAVPNIMTVNPALPAAAMPDFIAYAKANPGKLSYGSSGIGSVSHLMGEQFKRATGAELLHVPYRGIGPALNDAIGGHIQVMFDNLPTSLPLVEAGKLRALAVSSTERLPVLSTVPTFAELGLPDLDWMAFFGLIAPAKTPEAITRRLHASVTLALKSSSIREQLAAQQAIPSGNTPEEFAQQIAVELERHRAAAIAANIKID